ncbi:Hypothetical protein PFREUD_22000 [Propionibacterium freudenreichii subsp. shermanii CIRM-BIA1]|uniref:Uncharacterized protein n=1 Tax=Propionibacterium freudenreichii subsp. shermanii (strain ATCC 9614 / DSM 4902 / CIP 103027 / NCIMB 8099 / CIRM-BIA1) TaxID=754252 RepID=D7GGP2_PROFC|nr:Hypothetical protein PFREUD_22000 [Propionibacterium freudenreichii subsp. shermanii CIRM-BIA1]
MSGPTRQELQKNLNRFLRLRHAYRAPDPESGSKTESQFSRSVHVCVASDQG